MKVVLYKQNLETTIRPDLSLLDVCKLIHFMRRLGWKVKQSKLGELI